MRSLFKVLPVLLLIYAGSYIARSHGHPINANDINSINSLSQKPQIDPKIGKALLKVLHRFEKANQSSPTDSERSNYSFSDADANEYKQSIGNQSQYEISSATSGSQVEDGLDDDRYFKWEYLSNGTIKQFNFNEVPDGNASTANQQRSLNDDANRNSFNINPNNDYRYNDDNADVTVDRAEEEALFLQLKQRLVERLQQNVNGKNSVSSSDKPSPPRETMKPEESMGIYGAPRTDYIKVMIAAEETKPTNEKEIQSKKDNDDKTVEIFQAPLVAAFTLEQDQYGLPKRVVPLNNFSKNYLENMTKRLNQQISKNSLDSSGDASGATRNAEQNTIQTSAESGETKKGHVDIEEKLVEILRKRQELDFEKEKYLLELEKRKILKNREHSQPLKYASNGVAISSSVPEFMSINDGSVDFQKSVEFYPSKPNYLEFPPSQSAGPTILDYPPSLPSGSGVGSGSGGGPKIASFSEFPPSSIRSSNRLASSPLSSSSSSSSSSIFSEYAPIFTSANGRPPSGPVFRSNRNEPPRFVGNYEYTPHQHAPPGRPEIIEFDRRPYVPGTDNVPPSFLNRHKPDFVDKQLQSLIYQSDIPKNAKFEDINIVSKVLSLNHHPKNILAASSSNAHQRIKFPPDNVFAESSPPFFSHPSPYQSVSALPPPPSYVTYKYH